MYYGNIKYYDIANGDGVRTSLFVSGCNHHCNGCFNKESWDFEYGKFFDSEALENISKSLEPEYISGLTILGGEPLDYKNINIVHAIILYVKEKYPEKTIWVYTGYTYEELVGREHLITNSVLRNIDVLVDGKFIEELKDISLKFRGSSNQRIIDVKKSIESNQIILVPIIDREYNHNL